jgi:hypothetical protein
MVKNLKTRSIELALLVYSFEITVYFNERKQKKV